MRGPRAALTVLFAAALAVCAASRPARADFPAFGGVDIGESLRSIREGSEALNQRITLEEIALRRRPRRRHHRIRKVPAKTINPPASRFPVRGLDVSGYQGDIDWARVAAAPEHYAFVYLRAAHGLEPDDHFAQYWAGARAQGLRVGAYQFYEVCQDATQQADLFIRLTPRAADALPEVVDIEASKDCPNLPPKDVFLKNLKVFTDLFTIAYGRRPMLYVNHDVYKNYFAGDPLPNKLWFADPREEPVLPDGRAWDFWQYAWKGKVPGIDDNQIDFDVFRGSRAEFDAAFPVTLDGSLAGTN